MILILPPSGNYSRSNVPADTTGGFVANYPAANAVDDSSATVAKLVNVAAGLTIDLGATRSPNVAALINHTYDDGLTLYLNAASDSGFSTILYTVEATALKPNVWFDLRAHTGQTPRYFRVSAGGASNSRVIAVGEWIIGLADEYSGVLDSNPQRIGKGWAERQYTEYGVLVKVTSGVQSRGLRWQTRLPLTEAAAMAATFADAGAAGRRVLVVPDTYQADVFWIDWPGLLSPKVPHHLEHQIPLDLPEEMAGVV